ncbi:hypothetical protein AB0O01_06425 [Streptomyces sp. NPDC093252]|uniref:hypothetical protein n=1 Tax=Streptomyces sp. NPDC093252 TaxID=3154980 RepID=UPI0034171E59
MHGHGYTQPVNRPPSTGVLVFLRVLFVVISVCSIGMLAWTMLLRLAIVTRKSLDWGLFVAVVAADILAVVLISTEPGDEVNTVGGWTGMGLLVGTLVAAMAYYLAAETRHYHQLRYPYAPPPGTGPAPAYGYPQPQPQPPYTATTVSHLPPVPGPHRPAPQTGGPHTPVPPRGPHTPVPPSGGPHTPPPAPPRVPGPAGPGPAGPAQPPQQPPARIDQVRAELDELSDYLRNQDGRPEGGR